MYPNRQQQFKLERVIEACRTVYNYFVEKVNSDNNLSRNDMNYMLAELKEQEPWLNNYHSKMLQMVSTQVAGSIKALEELRIKGYNAGKGKLRFIKEGEYNTFTYNQSGFKIERHGNTDLLWLSKIGYVEMRLSRAIFNIKQITVTRSSNNKWYACVICEQSRPIQHAKIEICNNVVIDVGITKFLYYSDNNEVKNPQFLKRVLKPLKRTYRRFSRKQKSSKNREKSRTKLQILHERIRNKRNNFIHNLSTEYSKKYDLIFLERLRINNLAKNHHLAKSILDSGWVTFKRFLCYKAKLVIEVNPQNSSVECSACHKLVPKTLAVRTHHCNYCGLEIDRDYNASKNIQFGGLQQLGRLDLLLLPREPREFTPVEIGVPYSNAVCSQSMKQEEMLVAIQPSFGKKSTRSSGSSIYPIFTTT